jgi:hypothetical protein
LAPPLFTPCGKVTATAPGTEDPAAGEGVGEGDAALDGTRAAAAAVIGLGATAGPEGHPVPALIVATAASGGAGFFVGGGT